MATNDVFPRRPGWAWPALIALVVLIRLPGLLHSGPIDDEAVYAVVGRVMLGGGLPYLDAIERKPPLLFGVYWAVFRGFGPYNWLALHLTALVWTVLTMWGLDRTVRRFHGPRAGLLAALGYGVVLPFATAKNLAFNGEMLMNLPLVWAYALVLGRRDRPGIGWQAALAGALIALATLLKQPAAIAAGPLALYLAASPGRGAPVRFVLFGGGFAAVMAACAAILHRHGLLYDAWYWSVLDHTVPHLFWLRAVEHTALFLVAALPLIVPLFDRAGLRRVWGDRLPELHTLVGWTAVSVIGAAAGGRFYPHYYIQVIPPLAVLAGSWYAARLARPDAAWPRYGSPRFAALWLGIGALATVGFQSVQLRRLNAPLPAALYVKAHSQPADRLFVWGQATQVYADADRLPASRYIGTFPLTGYIFGERLPGVRTTNRIVPGSWDKLAADLAARPPRFIIDTQVQPGADYPVRDFPMLDELLRRSYRPVAVLPGAVIHERRADPISGS